MKKSQELRKRNTVALQIARETALLTLSAADHSLTENLSRLAQKIANLTGLMGALIIAYDDEGSPLTYGSYHLEVEGAKAKIQGISTLVKALPSYQDKNNSWHSIRSPLFPMDAGELQLLPIQSSAASHSCGLLLASSAWPQPSSLAALMESANVLAGALQTLIVAEAWARAKRLQELAHNSLNQPEGGLPDLHKVVQSLKDLFQADAVTLLLEDGGELLLASSTNPELGRDVNQPVVYRSGEGLTGTVFKERRALRLTNANDPNEVYCLCGLRREKPLHPEHDDEGLVTCQFLGVPMRSGDKCIGVLRMSRRGGIARFTKNDETALQFFADLLGNSLIRSWQLLLASGIFDSTSEAIAVSRRQRNDQGETWPKIVKINRGFERLLGMRGDELLGRDARRSLRRGSL